MFHPVSLVLWFVLSYPCFYIFSISSLLILFLGVCPRTDYRNSIHMTKNQVIRKGAIVFTVRPVLNVWTDLLLGYKAWLVTSKHTYFVIIMQVYWADTFVDFSSIPATSMSIQWLFNYIRFSVSMTHTPFEEFCLKCRMRDCPKSFSVSEFSSTLYVQPEEEIHRRWVYSENPCTLIE
jgi:hypothetical protein